MKRIALLIGMIAVFALCANAQVYINFHEMPIASTPSPMPDFYPSGMFFYWDNFYYVSPGLWTGEGAGFVVDPSTQHNSVAVLGGPLCNLTVACSGSIKLSPPTMNAVNSTFRPMTMTVSAGWSPNRVTVVAYNNSQFVGQVTWDLTTTPQILSFPATWRVTQLVFTPEFINGNTVNPKNGSLVIYTFTLMPD